MVALMCLTVLVACVRLAAQSPKVHYRYQGNEPPGAIGSWQLLRGGPLPGYFQPVEIKAPEGALISLAVDGAFLEPVKNPVRVGMLIAPVYRLRVTNIPLHEGQEVFPTIEVIDRLYPPVGERARFPIQVELTQDDLELALAGNYITRVVYLEDPGHALPVATGGKEQEWFDAGPGSNPVEIADRLGRPMAIVRLGGRVPDLKSGGDAAFFSGSPPFVPLSAGLPMPVACGPVEPQHEFVGPPIRHTSASLPAEAPANTAGARSAPVVTAAYAGTTSAQPDTATPSPMRASQPAANSANTARGPMPRAFAPSALPQPSRAAAAQEGRQQ